MHCWRFSDRCKSMRVAFVSIIFCVAVVATSPVRAQPDYRLLNQSLTDGVVLPAYMGMANAMTDLVKTTQTFCTTPTSASGPRCP